MFMSAVNIDAAILFIYVLFSSYGSRAMLIMLVISPKDKKSSAIIYIQIMVQLCHIHFAYLYVRFQ